MNWIIKRCWLALLLVADLAYGQAVTRYVSTNGAHTPPFTSWPEAATNINSAVSWANTNNAGDTVWISNGVYVLTATVSISNTIVKGFSGNYGDVIVNGNGSVGCFGLVHSNAFLAGLTATNGYATSYSGGIRVWGTNGCGTVSNCLITGCWGLTNGGVGFYNKTQGGKLLNSVVEYNTGSKASGGVLINPTAAITPGMMIKNCIIRNNISTNQGSVEGGGGVRIGYVGTMINCQVLSNAAEAASGAYGGGIYVEADGYMPYVISNCVIRGNTGGYGGGIAIRSCLDVKIYNCLIEANLGTNRGGGILFTAKTNQVFNCTIVNNTDSGAAFGAGGIINHDTFLGALILCNSIIYTNYATLSSYKNYAPTALNRFTNCCSSPVPSSYGTNNIGDYPKFVDPAGNYRLMRESPCINTGTNQDWMIGDMDLDGHSRLDRFSGQVDMGCYEFLPRGTLFSVH